MNRILASILLVTLAIFNPVFAQGTLIYEVIDEPGIDATLLVETEYESYIDVDNVKVFLDGNSVILEVEFVDRAYAPEELASMNISYLLASSVLLNIDGVDGNISISAAFGRLSATPYFLACQTPYSTLVGANYVTYTVNGKTATLTCNVPDSTLAPPSNGGILVLEVYISPDPDQGVAATDRVVVSDVDRGVNRPQEPIEDDEEPTEDIEDVDDMQLPLDIPLIIVGGAIALGVLAYIVKVFLKGLTGIRP